MRIGFCRAAASNSSNGGRIERLRTICTQSRASCTPSTLGALSFRSHMPSFISILPPFGCGCDSVPSLIPISTSPSRGIVTEPHSSQFSLRLGADVIAIPISTSPSSGIVTEPHSSQFSLRLGADVIAHPHVSRFHLRYVITPPHFRKCGTKNPITYTLFLSKNRTNFVRFYRFGIRD